LCDDNSLENTIKVESGDPHLSRVAAASNSWLDDYVSWILNPKCCRTFDENGSYCPSSDLTSFCSPCITSPDDTVDSFANKSYNHTRPNPPVFRRFLPFFLNSSCDRNCAVCGTGHLMNLHLETDSLGNITVPVSRFGTYHTVLQAQSDYIWALRSGKQIADTLSAEHGLDIYPYSVFYVYFEQYLYIEKVAVVNVLLALSSIACLSFVILQNVAASVVIVIVVLMIVLDLVGLMSVWGVSLNAISVVNIVMAVGVSVEFCIHIISTFIRMKPESMQKSEHLSNGPRVAQAMIEMGSCVISGIFLTKFVGILVLYFAKSDLFEIYYFRMYLLICLIAGAHGLILLPSILTLLPPKWI
jgi:Niemann-Pick C1 protein